jgi:VanZ family protein
MSAGRVDYVLYGWWALAVFYALFIFALSSFPPGAGGGGLPVSDKILHVILYLFFGAILFLALAKSFGTASASKVFLAAFSIAALYGITDEFHQSFVEDRTPSILDWLADALGSFLGALAALLVKRKTEAKNA